MGIKLKLNILPEGMSAGFGLLTSLPHSSCSSMVKLLSTKDNRGTSVVTMSAKDVMKAAVLKACNLLINIFGNQNEMSQFCQQTCMNECCKNLGNATIQKLFYL